MVLALSKISVMLPQSLFAPSLIKISSLASSTPKEAQYLTKASCRKSQPCSGPQPRKVACTPISLTAFSIASTTQAARGRVTSPMPKRIIFLSGLAAAKAFTLRAMSAKRQVSFKLVQFSLTKAISKIPHLKNIISNLNYLVTSSGTSTTPSKEVAAGPSR